MSEAQIYSSELEETFEHVFWPMCPRKIGKMAARRLFIRMAQRHGQDVLIDGMTRAVAVWQASGIDTKFIPHPSTWLRDGRWLDEMPSAAIATDHSEVGELYELACAAIGSCCNEKKRENALHACGILATHCESPIEKLLAVAIFGTFSQADNEVVLFKSHCAFKPVIDCLRDARYHEVLFIAPQVVIDQYRADLVVGFVHSSVEPDGDETFKVTVAAIECDGFEFHNCTKEQVTRDRRRDRQLLLNHRVPTCRFTGSEIFTDPISCAAEVDELLWVLMNTSPIGEIY